jgi:rod shape-determining protein MreC
LVLFFLDRGLHCFSVLRTAVPFVTAPFQRDLNWSINLVKLVSDSLKEKQTLLKEAAVLRSELLLTNTQLQRLNFLEQENSQLRALLNLTKQLKTKFLAANLLSMPVDSVTQQIIIDKGSVDGLYLGQPVIDAYGILGQVVTVEPEFSKVLLVTDVKSAVPVVVVRNSIQCIVVGTGRVDSLELINTPETTDIKEGDVLVTSGTGQRFPVGYIVGTIRSIKHILGERFIKVLITPNAHINSIRNVLLVWPHEK